MYTVELRKTGGLRKYFFSIKVTQTQTKFTFLCFISFLTFNVSIHTDKGVSVWACGHEL